MSHIGEQLIAPEGHGPLVKNCTYHYLGRQGEMAEVLLVSFDEKPGAYLNVISSGTFESALEERQIIAAPAQSNLPPWLKCLEGQDLSTLDDSRKRSRQSHLSRVDHRLSQISPLLELEAEILASKNPELEISRIARRSNPRVHRDRAILWFFTYLAFGRDKWVLLPPFNKSGKWDRAKINPEKKRGRPSLSKGKGHGSGLLEEDHKKIDEGYIEFGELGVFLNTVYTKTITKKFGCEVRTKVGRQKEFYHPNGHRFPTFYQFRRSLHKRYGATEIQLRLYGETRMRSKKSSSKGKFSEQVGNLLEHIEGDAYYLKEVPTGALEGNPMPPLCVVRLICHVSGMLVGIGFSIGRERASAYRMALFSMAIPKDQFCAMFGISITREEWPCMGLPSWATFDRGPGAVQDLIRDFEYRIPIRSLAPSYSGQSKANIESSHPRDIKFEGNPTFIQSDLTYVELARREIRRTIADNQMRNSDARMTNSMLSAMANQLPTPICIWDYLDGRRRTHARPIPFDVSIRSLLTPMEFSMREDGVYLHGQRFDSEALRETGIHDMVVASGVAKVKGYVFDLSVRQVWVEVDKHIILAHAYLPIRGHEEQLYISLPELAEMSRIRARLQSKLREHRTAVEAEAREKFEVETGINWDAGRRKSGVVKRGTAAAKQEFSDTTAFTSIRKRRA